MLGLGDIWRPVSLTPSLTWNSLLAMTVPFAALLLAMRLNREDYPQLMLAIVIIACVSALLAMIQILSGIGSGVYPYRITNSGMMVGLFANRNHHAIFQACAVLVSAMMLRDELMRKRQSKQLILFLGFAFVLLTAMTALIGSRAGFVAGVAAFTVGYAMIVPAWRDNANAKRGVRTAPAPTRISTILQYSPPVLLAALLVTILQFSARTTSLNRVLDQSAVEDLRAQAWPTVREMVGTYWTTGSGLGSFPEVFQIFEPDALLRPQYFNRAHNDWVEAIIGGGLPFVLIILALIVWLGRKIVTQDRRHLVKGYRGDPRLAMMVMLLLLAAASFVDYPLRVPSIQVMAIMLITMFYCNSPAPMRRD
ncbi:O-antigen ligase family protein [Sphingopyxis sp. J-6]|uniref:O-antigen ligase family protein n=1 Tax=Sphingopyxis sp. J-6 TaxID=3122054 RepID=UPI0039840EA2